MFWMFTHVDRGLHRPVGESIGIRRVERDDCSVEYINGVIVRPLQKVSMQPESYLPLSITSTPANVQLGPRIPKGGRIFEPTHSFLQYRL